MATIKIAGGAAALISGLTLEEIKLLEKYNPKALALRDGDEEIFRVSTGSKGGISKFGMCFAAATRDAAALAEVTQEIPADVTDAKEFAVETIGAAVLSLNSVEAQAKDALAGLKTQLDLVRETVSVA